jgi:hypothetical protein
MTTITLVNAAISGYPATMQQRVMAETLQRHRLGGIALFAGPVRAAESETGWSTIYRR